MLDSLYWAERPCGHSTSNILICAAAVSGGADKRERTAGRQWGYCSSAVRLRSAAVYSLYSLYTLGTLLVQTAVHSTAALHREFALQVIKYPHQSAPALLQLYTQFVNTKCWSDENVRKVKEFARRGAWWSRPATSAPGGPQLGSDTPGIKLGTEARVAWLTISTCLHF